MNEYQQREKDNKQVLTNDEIIYYAVPDTNGKISYNHKITALELTTFYAEFKESINCIFLNYNSLCAKAQQSYHHINPRPKGRGYS